MNLTPVQSAVIRGLAVVAVFFVVLGVLLAALLSVPAGLPFLAFGGLVGVCAYVAKRTLTARQG